MLYTLSKDFAFEASHQLPDHDGKCARLHGHSWRVTVALWGRALHRGGPKAGMLIDYGDIKAIVSPLIERLDHSHLNVTLAEELDGQPPTSEAIGAWLFRQIRDALLPVGEDVTALGVSLKSVTIHETCSSACTVEA